jgi:tRNA G18 (ribose-2'-O)-methylase SpoU
VDDWPDVLRRVRGAGYEIVALTPREGAGDLRACAAASTGRTALLLGHEGDGLSEAALAEADRLARITMAPGVDSVNVAAAAGIALHAYFRYTA